MGRRGFFRASGGGVIAREAERSGDLVFWSLLPPPSTSFRGASTLPLSLAMSALGWGWDSISRLLLDSLLWDNLLIEEGGFRPMPLAAEEQTSQLHHPIIIFSADMKKRQSKIGQQLNQIVTEIP